MKKLYKGNFLLILVGSLLGLVILVVLGFYFLNSNEDTFTSSGYVLNPLSSTQEKYYFDEDTSYRENLSNMIEFVDVDDNSVEVVKDSFIHYLDGSLSFMKKGAILDIDSLSSDKDVVKFYNVSSEVMISKASLGYVIKSTNGDIELNNFIGRISDDKYIVVGELGLQMAGNSRIITGDYFEIVYTDDGVVKIGNKDVLFEVVAEGTVITVGNEITVDLGKKTIDVNGESVMSITEIIINGDENIEVVPVSDDDVDKTNDGNNGSNNNGNDSDSDDNNNGEDTNTGNEIAEGTGVIISLSKLEVGSTDINAEFSIVGGDDDNFKLQVVNLASGKTVEMVSSIKDGSSVSINLLTPEEKYLLVVTRESDNGKYFQKVVETTSFGITMDKLYTTDSSITYKVTVGSDTDIRNAKITLYKFNEETMKNEVVVGEYFDSTTEENVKSEKVVYLTDLVKDGNGEYEVTFDGLDSNTIYTAVMDEFSIVSTNYKDIYNITDTSLTLKKTPSFSDLKVQKDTSKTSFSLSLDGIVDTDKAITSYTYMIYNKSDNSLAVNPITNNSDLGISVNIGDNDNELKVDTNYYYKVIIEYYDNEKYVEYVTSDSITFVMGTEPYITVVPNEGLISYNSIGATVYLIDKSCSISIPGREGCSDASSTVIDVGKINPITGERVTVYSKKIDFMVSDDDISYEVYVDNLQAGMQYDIIVRAVINGSDTTESQEILHTEDSKRTITTKSLMTFTNEWSDEGSNELHVVNVTSKLIANEDSGTLSADESAGAIKLVKLSLYEGGNISDIDAKIPLKEVILTNTDDLNIKESFYDNGYTITTEDTFGLTLDNLKEMSSDGKISEYYTVKIDAYFDTGKENEVSIANNVISYKVSPILLMDDIEEPVLVIDKITNKASGKIFSNLKDDGTVVGYSVMAAFDRTGLIANGIIPNNINIYVYNASGERVKFYVKNSDGELVLTDTIRDSLGDSNYYETDIYMDYGSEYDDVDSIMRRGEEYYVGYVLDASSNGNSISYPTNMSSEVKASSGLYEKVVASKESPYFTMYIAKSDSSTITYAYNVVDVDNAIYKSNGVAGFYTRINDGDEILLELTESDESSYDGRFTITGLSNQDKYNLYYKKDVTKTGNIDNDIVVTYTDTDKDKLFDGYYDLSKMDISYEVINNSLVDNKVIIKILGSIDAIKRIISYRLTFTDSLGNSLVYEDWSLDTCSSSDTESRCLNVDYTELKNAGMKSTSDTENLISVQVQAIYDTGLTGYDYVVGSDGDYPYMIMQNNNTTSAYGSYVTFSKAGQLTTWSESLGVPYGYYSYKVNKSLIYYESELDSSKSGNISYSKSSSGYTSKFGILNPKMVDEYMLTTDDNTFSFASITPKVKISKQASLLNGAAVNITLSGVDLSDILNEGSSNNPEYYLYIDTWNSSDLVGDSQQVVRPTLKVQIDNDNPTETLLAYIDGVSENDEYFYNVYAKLYKDGVAVYTQLFDSSYVNEYKAVTYEFSSLKGSDVFQSIDTNYSASGDTYGDRILTTKINLLAYQNSIPVNYELGYVLCNNSDTCSMDNNIFSELITGDDIGTSTTKDTDITEYDLEYDRNYVLYVYARIEVYDGSELTTKDVLINRTKSTIKLRKLVEPGFVVTRNAGISNSEYYVDFSIMTQDIDETLIDGKYYVMLTDSDGNIVGTMQLLNESGDYYEVNNYSEYAMDASAVNKKVRFIGLDANTKYTFTVYSDAYLNNYSEETEAGIDNRSIQIKKSYTVYSTNSYGVAFGNDILYSATEKSIIVTFLGGSNFDNVKEVNYTIGLWDSDEVSTLTGTYVIGENNKYFELYQSTDDWRFVIDPDDMKNVEGQTYTINLSFKVLDTESGDYVTLTSAYNSAFEGRVQYVIDDEK